MLIVVVVVVVEQESLRLGVLRVVLRVFRLPCVFWGFCIWVLEASCSPAQMRTQDGPAFRGSPYISCFCTSAGWRFFFKSRSFGLSVGRWIGRVL